MSGSSSIPHGILSEYAAAAARAAAAAGDLIRRHFGARLAVQTKRSPVDLVTSVDRAAERLIAQRLTRAYPAVGFFGEEYGERKPEARYRWVVDPIDGTNNFVHGLPIIGVSIGLQDCGSPAAHRSRRGAPPAGAMLVGIIYDPLRRELFAAVQGAGATLNGRRIAVSPTRRLAHSLVSTGFSSNFLKRRQPYLRWFETLQRRSHGVRRIGSTVWCLAAVAAGRLEAFYELDLWPWDMAAGILLVKEAGGRVSNFAGGPPVLEQGRLVASNGWIHRELLEALKTTPPRG